MFFEKKVNGGFFQTIRWIFKKPCNHKKKHYFFAEQLILAQWQKKHKDSVFYVLRFCHMHSKKPIVFSMVLMTLSSIFFITPFVAQANNAISEHQQTTIEVLDTLEEKVDDVLEISRRENQRFRNQRANQRSTARDRRTCWTKPRKNWSWKWHTRYQRNCCWNPKKNSSQNLRCYLWSR